MVGRCAEYAQRRVSLELVHPAAVSGDDLDYHRKEPVERFDDGGRWTRCGEGGGADDVDEEHGNVAVLATEVLVTGKGVAGDVLADVAAEEVADALALSQAGHHAVEASLQQADFTAVVDGNVSLEITPLDVGQRSPDRAERIGDRPRGDNHGRQTGRGRESGQEEHGYREALWRAWTAEQEDGGDQPGPQQRESGPERPRQHDAGCHTGKRRLLRDTSYEGERDRRTQ